MTRTISFTVVLAVVALVVAVPAWSSPDTDERIDLGFTQQSTQPSPDVLERAAAAHQRSLDNQSASLRYSDSASTAIERAATTPTSFERALTLRGQELNRKYGLGEYASTNGFVQGDEPVRIVLSDQPTAVPTSSPSGREIEWPQIGFGFGIGILLMLGIALTVRFMRVPPLAH